MMMHDKINAVLLKVMELTPESEEQLTILAYALTYGSIQRGISREHLHDILDIAYDASEKMWRAQRQTAGHC